MAKTIKVSEKIGQRLHDTGFANNFLDMTPKHRGQKERKIDKLNLSKLKTFVHQRILLSEEKITHRMGQCICKLYIYGKGLNVQYI